MARVKGITITFDEYLSEDEAVRVVTAISMIKGVATVAKSELTGEDVFNRQHIRHEYREKMLKALREIFDE